MQTRIVVVRYRFIGDMVLTIPFLKQLRQRFPYADITVWAGADSDDLLDHCPYINRVLAVNPRKMGFWATLKQLKAGQFTHAYLLKRSFSSALLAALAHIPYRIGFDTQGRGFLLTHRVPYKAPQQHEARCFLDLLYVPPSASLAVEAWIPQPVHQSVAHWIVQDGNPCIALHATSTHPAKCWPMGYFIQLAQQLISQYNAHIYCLGSAQERIQYQEMEQALQHTGRLHQVCGKTSVLQTQALLARMRLLVANDSGLAHLAAAVQTPTVSLFGPTSAVQWQPLNSKALVAAVNTLPCQPCRLHIRCQNQYPCLTQLLPQDVFAQCQTQLTLSI